MVLNMLCNSNIFVCLFLADFQYKDSNIKIKNIHAEENSFPQKVHASPDLER